MKPVGQRGENRKSELVNLPGKQRHGEANAESSKESLVTTSENRLPRLNQKVRNPAVLAFVTKLRTDTAVPGLQMAPKALTIILHMELGKPHELPISGKNLARGTNCSGGRGDSKKRMPACNRQDRIA